MPNYLASLETLRAAPPVPAYLPQGGCPEPRIANLVTLAAQRLGVDLPAAYLEFLRVTDGYRANGSCWYAADPPGPGVDRLIPGLVCENLLRRRLGEYHADWIAFGHSDLFVFAYHPATETYHANDFLTGESTHRFRHFDEMATAALAECLGRYADEGAFLPSGPPPAPAPSLVREPD